MIRHFLPTKAATVQTLGHPAAGVIGWFDGSTNTTGEPVTQATALTFAAVWCATRVIAETIATLPCLLYRRTGEDGRERANDDERYWLISEEPHPLISAVSFFESQTAQMVLNGNCYAKIVQASGMPARLEPRTPDRVTLEVDGNTIRYEVRDPDETLSPDACLHVAGLGGDGLSGWSVLKYAQQSIGQGLAADKYAGAQWGNGATPRGVLTHPMRLDKPAREMIRTEWDNVHKGASNAGKIAILHGGMGFQAISMSNEDAQFLQSRQFSIREIARWFRLPPHMLADLADSSVRANIEQQAIEFIVYSLKPWLVRWEQALNRKLLAKDERRTMYYEFLLESLLRGDSAAQAQAWSVGRQWGWLSVNEIRRQQNLPPIEGGDVYLQPSNMVPADSDMAKGDKAPPPQAFGGGGPPEPDADDEDVPDEEDTPDSVRGELRGNLRASLNAILDQGKELAATASTALEKAAARANDELTTTLRSLRETRDDIRNDLLAPRKVQAFGWDAGKASLIEACNVLLRDHARCQLRVEKAEVTKASRMVARGHNFLGWMEHWYGEHEATLVTRFQEAVRCMSAIVEPRQGMAKQLASDYCQRHVQQLLDATDGDRDTFTERVQEILQGWQSDVDSLELKEQRHVA